MVNAETLLELLGELRGERTATTVVTAHSVVTAATTVVTTAAIASA